MYCNEKRRRSIYYFVLIQYIRIPYYTVVASIQMWGSCIELLVTRVTVAEPRVITGEHKCDVFTRTLTPT